MKKKIYLVGAGDLGIETEFLMRRKKGFLSEFEIAGFLDDNPNALEGKKTSLEVVGASDFSSFKSGDQALITVSNSKVKRILYEKLKEKVAFHTFIADDVIIADNAQVGQGSIIFSNCIVSVNAYIGEQVTINFSSRIGHDARIGSFSSLMCSVDIGGHTLVGENVFIGTGATIIHGRSIKDNIIIGAGGVVLRNLNKLGTYIGNPVQLIN